MTEGHADIDGVPAELLTLFSQRHAQVDARLAELVAVRRLVAERRIPFLKWGHLLRFDPAEIEAWLDGARRQ